MSVSAKIKHYLDRHRLRYHVLSHDRTVTLQDAAQALQISPFAFARAVILEDEQGYLMAVLPLDRKIDFGLLQKLVQRKMSIAPRIKVDKLFSDCEPGSHPPLGDAYTIPSVIDTALLNVKTIYFEPGSHTAIVQIGRDDFHYLTANATWGNFSVPLSHPNDPSCHFVPQQALTDALIQLHNPGLDTLAESMRIPERLPYIMGEKDPAILVQKVAQDPWLSDGLSALEQLVPFEKTPMRLEALINGLEIIQLFNIQSHGPLGKRQLYVHAFLSTAAALRVLQLYPQFFESMQREGLLGVLLHNIGFWVVGHCYQPEYALLNKMALVNPTALATNLERRLLGLGHAQKIIQCGHARIGAWLLQKYGLPFRTQTLVREHHTDQRVIDTRQKDVSVVHWILLTQGCDFELKRLKIGDGSILDFAWPTEPPFDTLALTLPSWLEERVELAGNLVDTLLSK